MGSENDLTPSSHGLSAAAASRSREAVKPGIAPRIDGPKVHDLKCAAGYYEAVELGHKTAELRFNDRDFRPLDILRLHEFEYGKLTGRTLDRRITHIVWDSNGPWLAPGHCMLSLSPLGGDETWMPIHSRLDLSARSAGEAPISAEAVNTSSAVPIVERLKERANKIRNGHYEDEFDHDADEIDEAASVIQSLAGALEELRLVARVLLQNAEGCAANHYGNDFQEFGPPGWLADSENTIAKAEAALSSLREGG